MGELLSVDCIFLSKSNCISLPSQIDTLRFAFLFQGCEPRNNTILKGANLTYDPRKLHHQDSSLKILNWTFVLLKVLKINLFYSKKSRRSSFLMCKVGLRIFIWSRFKFKQGCNHRGDRSDRGRT